MTHKKVTENAKQITHFLECSDKETSAIFFIPLKQTIIRFLKNWFCLAWKFLFLINSVINVQVMLVAEEAAGICYLTPQYLFSIN